MAKPRPPIIISNGGMRDKFDKRRKKLGKTENITDILYDADESGIASLVTLTDGSQLVYWREKSDTTNFSSSELGSEYNILGEIELSHHVSEE